MTLEVKKNSQDNLFIFSVGFFILTLVLFFGFYIWNNNIKGQIDGESEIVGNYTKSIKELRDKKEIQVYELIQVNKKYLNDLEKKSKISKFVYHLKDIEKKYKLDFKGFNYNDGVLTSKITAQNTTVGSAEKTSDFIKKYRKEKNAIFALDFINSFNGGESIEFNTKFTLK